MQLLPAIEQSTGRQPDRAVIWLHGLGADGNDFASIIPALHLPAGLSVRFIFPHAPSIPVTVNGGYVMPAWYDIVEMEIDRQVDTDGLLQSVQMIRLFVDREIDRGIPPENIALAGFSQGGAVVLHLALSYQHRLAGLLAMSTYLATAKELSISDAAKKMPILIHHGEYDPVVPERLGRQAADMLQQQGCQVSYQHYPMEHAVCPEQIDDISRWLQAVLQ